MANAIWRDKEREKNVKTYREQEKKDAQDTKSYNKDFIRYVIKMLYYEYVYFYFYEK